MIGCAVALVLLMDASGSILPREWELQRDGHAAAFEDAGVQRAIARDGGVAVTAIAFSDFATPMLGWRLLRDAEDARRFAAELRAAPRGPVAGTDIGVALSAAIAAMDRAPCAPEQEVIDLVTDGEDFPEGVQRARAEAESRGIRINALGVGAPEAAEWLRENAVTQGGFALAAETWQAFQGAMRRKLSMELAAR